MRIALAPADHTVTRVTALYLATWLKPFPPERRLLEEAAAAGTRKGMLWRP
jgi:hypothetical protein